VGGLRAHRQGRGCPHRRLNLARLAWEAFWFPGFILRVLSRAAATNVPGEGSLVAERGDHQRFDGMKPVLRLVEDDRSVRLEHLFGHLQCRQTSLLEDLQADLGLVLCSAGRQCMNFASGLPVAAMSGPLTW